MKIRRIWPYLTSRLVFHLLQGYLYPVCWCYTVFIWALNEFFFNLQTFSLYVGIATFIMYIILAFKFISNAFFSICNWNWCVNNTLHLKKAGKLWMSEWLLFNINEQFFSYIMTRTSHILIRWRWCPLCTSPTSLVEFL